MADITQCFGFVVSSNEGGEFGQVYASLHHNNPTSHGEGCRGLLHVKIERTVSELNGRQFGQVYSLFFCQTIHSQTPHTGISQMHDCRTERTPSSANLFHSLFSQRILSNTT